MEENAPYEEIRGEYWVDIRHRDTGDRMLAKFHSTDLDEAKQFVVGFWAGARMQYQIATDRVPQDCPTISVINYRQARDELKMVGYDIRLSHPFDPNFKPVSVDR